MGRNHEDTKLPTQCSINTAPPNPLSPTTMSLRNSLSSLLPSIPYAHPSAALRGYWLPQTSTINWCEEDYYATIYIAELVNTLTNGLFVLLAIKGVRSCLRNDHDRIFLVTFCGYAAVGTGSFLFHGTLKCMLFFFISCMNANTGTTLGRTWYKHNQAS